MLTVRALALATLIAAIAVGAATFWPQQLGGQTAFVIVMGNSMEPRYRAGDLVITRQRTRYEPGTVAVYRHDDIGQVIHRIVAREPGGFVFKGDNNSYLDGGTVAPSAIEGAEWFVVPGAGRWLHPLQSPAAAGALAGLVIAGLFTVQVQPRRRWHPAESPHWNREGQT